MRARDSLKAISLHEDSREDQRFSGHLTIEELQKNCQTVP